MLKYIKIAFNLKNILYILIYSTIPGLVFYTIAFNIMHQNGFHTVEIIRDFPQLMHASSFLGFLSSIGSWLWVSASAIAFFGFITTKSPKAYGQKTLLFLLGIFSLLLAIDDFFMIHDRYINQNICYVTYAFLPMILLIRYYKTIMIINGFGFIFAGALLATSSFIDLIQTHLPFKYSSVQIFEEGFKFTGGATWLYFVALVAAYQFTDKTKREK